MRRKIITTILFFFGGGRLKPKNKDLKKMEFSSSTQKIGAAFNEKIRDSFRKRWVKKS